MAREVSMNWTMVSDKLPPDRVWVLVITTDNQFDRACLNRLNSHGTMEWYLPSGPVLFGEGYVVKWCYVDKN